MIFLSSMAAIAGTLAVLATPMGSADSYAPPAPRTGAVVPKTFKAHGHRFRVPDTFGGGTAWANGTRARVVVPPGATGRVKYFWPTYTRGGTNFADQDLLYDVNFQAAISKTWNNTYTGLTPRTSFLTNGAKTASYLAASPQGPGILSDVLDLGTVTPGTFVDVFCSFEAAAKVSQGSSKIPTGLFFGSTKFNVCEVSKNVSSSLADVDWCASVTDVNSDGKNNVGGFAGLLFWEVPVANRLVYAIGHSITWGTGSGDLTVTNDGDLRGDPDGFLGYFDGWMKREGLMYVNAGKPTDQIQYRADPTKTTRSQQLAAMIGATDIYLADLTNDVFGRTTAQMTTDTQTVLTAFGNAIAAALGKQPLKTMAVMYPKASGPVATSLTSAGTTTVTVSSNLSINVGETVVITGASPTTYNGTFVVTSVNPGVSFTYEALSAPASSPATGTIVLDDRLIKANGLNQVPFSSFGPGSKADTMDTATRALQLGNDRFVDLAAAVRYGATNSYLWLTDPANPYPYVKDRIHANSRGIAKIIAEAPVYPS
jgi:hypothetical protein